jgi:levansucrase
MHTFTPDLEGYDGLYGFVADSLRGDYRPLNGSGLVVTNPATTPYQAYSWMAFPHDEGVLVQSFSNYYDFTGASLDDIADLPDGAQRDRFGGTLAPTLCLAVDDDRTRLRGTLAPWHVPTADERLSLTRPDLPPGALGERDRGRSGDRSRGSYG